jgi:hypothetical protein
MLPIACALPSTGRFYLSYDGYSGAAHDNKSGLRQWTLAMYCPRRELFHLPEVITAPLGHCRATCWRAEAAAEREWGNTYKIVERHEYFIWRKIGARLELIGAEPGSVIVYDMISVNLQDPDLRAGTKTEAQSHSV